jgi:hypothetical protein
LQLNALEKDYSLDQLFKYFKLAFDLVNLRDSLALDRNS